MSKIKLIRCKTPHDIIVIRKREDFNAFRDETMTSNAERDITKCGHPHQIVCGDIYFSTPRGRKA